MADKGIEIGRAKGGVNEKAKETDLPQSTARVLKNLNVSNEGKIRRRDGFIRRVVASVAHSIYTHNGFVFAVVDNALQMLDTDTWDLTVVRGGVGPSRLSYAAIGGVVYYSNGTVSGRYDTESGQHYSSMAPPTPGAPNLSVASGGLKPGKYMVSITQVSSDGVESGAPIPVPITLTASEGIRVDVPVTDGTRETRVYCSEVNGSNLFLEARMPFGAGFTVITGLSHGKELRTLLVDPLPAGSILRAHKGRLYSADNNVLWYSEPLLYGLTKLDYNYLPPFSGPITMIEPVDGGLFVAADAMYFLSGTSPADMQFTVLDTAPAIPGSSMVIDGQLVSKDINGQVAYWYSSEGAVIGLPNGAIRNLTQDKLEGVEDAASAASALIRTAGVDRVLTNVAGSPRDGFGASDSATIEVIKSTSQ